MNNQEYTKILMRNNDLMKRSTTTSAKINTKINDRF